MQVPILAGITADASAALRVEYPVNMMPVPGQDGIADGYLRPTEGIAAFTTGVGADRGSIVWNGVHYRVSGTSLISISAAGVVTVIGSIPGTDLVRMDFSFDRLAIAAGGILYYYNGTTLTHVTDPNIGTVNDMGWVDGYFMTTDGTFILVTEITDPTTVNPLKYGSTDEPDPVQCLLKVQNEVHVVSRNFIDVFQNTGGVGFPFQRQQAALITKGAVGKRAACVLNDAVAFVGGGRNEAPSVWLGHNAQTAKIASVEIERQLAAYTDAQLSAVLLQAVVDVGCQLLFVHLPDRLLVYDALMSAAAGQPVWHIRTSAISGFSQYLGINALRVNGQWIVGHPTTGAIGVWSTTDTQHYGVDVRWEFATPILRGDGTGAIVKQLELVALTGSVPAGRDPMISTSSSEDGISWSQDRAIRSGKRGDTTRRLVWLQQGRIRNQRIQRFRGDSSSRLSALRLEAQMEALAY